MNQLKYSSGHNNFGNDKEYWFILNMNTHFIKSRVLYYIKGLFEEIIKKFLYINNVNFLSFYTWISVRLVLGWKLLKGESYEILKYFGNVRHNLAALDIFAKFMKMTNYTGLRDAELTWYSLIVTHWICLSSLGIHGFRPNWSCLIADVLATQAKFLETSG